MLLGETDFFHFTQKFLSQGEDEVFLIFYRPWPDFADCREEEEPDPDFDGLEEEPFLPDPDLLLFVFFED